MTALPALARLFWMLIGPLALFMLAVTIARTGNGWFTPADFAFLAFLAGLILARWVEFQQGHAETASGNPATLGHLGRYMIGAIALGLGVWILANLVGNHVFTP